MHKNGKSKADLSPQRFFTNAKETLKKSPIKSEHYHDAKFVAEASGMAYLAALKAIYEYAESKGISLKKDRPKSYEGVSHLIEKLPQRNKLHHKFKSVYDILHVGGYYNQFTSVKVIKYGFKEAEDILKMLD
ncbi:MAG: DUF5618 family protein [Chitinophagales bacterium]